MDGGDDGPLHRAGYGHLGQLEGDGAGVPDDAGADLDQLQSQAGPRPVNNCLGQRDEVQESGKVGGN